MTILQVDSSYRLKPRTVAMGGSGLATYTTQNGIIVAGTTTTSAHQNIGAGTSGQMPVSAGTSAVPVWTDQNQLGAWTSLGSVTASSSATVDFTNLSTTYYVYKFLIYQFYPASNAVNFQMQFSSNNGSSYDTGASDYRYSGFLLNEAFTAATNLFASSAAAAMNIGNSWSSNLNNNVLEIYIVNPALSQVRCGIYYIGKYNDNTWGFGCMQGIGTRAATQANNAVRFKFSSGNIASGFFKMYGIKA